VTRQSKGLAARVAASLAAVGLVTTIYHAFVPVNPTTVALTYVVVVLTIATRRGIAESTVASVGAVACFNFFFLPPYFTWTIADTQNWVAFLVFMLTAIMVSQLSGRARQRHIEALARQRDLERLYALSRALLLSESGTAMPGVIARHIADAFELQTVGVYDQRTDVVAWAGSAASAVSDNTLRDTAQRGAALDAPGGVKIVAIQLGGVPIGSVAMIGAQLSDTVVHSILNLAAIGLERSRGEEATARAEAARQSSELRATVEISDSSCRR
jgi:two-component system sensor histidine kinase KdpD